MRQWFMLVSLTALIGLGCSHKETKAEATDTTKPATTTQIEKTKVEATKTESHSRLECAHKGDTRILENREKGKGCELAYTKGGKETVVASSANGTAYCEKALEKLSAKLKDASFECK